MPRLNIAPSRAAGRASALFLEHVLEHRLVQGQVSHDLLEATILLLERLDPPELGHAHARVLLLPGIEGRLTHPELPAQLGRWRALLRFAQGLGDLLLGVARLLHRRSSVSQRTALQPDSQPSPGPDFGGQVRHSVGLRYPSAWCGRSVLYQRIHAVISHRASAKSRKTCCQTHSSLRLRKNRSTIPFCSGV